MPPLVAIASIGHLPDELQEEAKDMIARRLPYHNVQATFRQAGYSVSIEKIKEWAKQLPLLSIKHVSQLPAEIRDKLSEAQRTKVPYSETIKYLAEHGYAVQPDRLKAYNNQLLRMSHQEEMSGTVEPGKPPLSKELEHLSLTFLLDFFLETITQAKKRPQLDTVGDFERVGQVILRIIDTSIKRRKLELEEDGVIEKVRGMFKTEFQRRLSGHPEIVAKLVEITDKIGDDLSVEPD